MPSFLADPSPAFLLLLGIAALVAFGIWFRWRNRKVLFASVGLLVLLAATLLISWRYESPREQAVRRVNAMCGAVSEGDFSKFMDNVSMSDVKSLERKAAGVAAVCSLAKKHNAKVTAWGFSRDDTTYVGDREIIIGFLVKAEASDFTGLKYVKATFENEVGNDWRLKDAAFYNAIKTTELESLPIPNFP